MGVLGVGSYWGKTNGCDVGGISLDKGHWGWDITGKMSGFACGGISLVKDKWVYWGLEPTGERPMGVLRVGS